MGVRVFFLMAGALLAFCAVASAQPTAGAVLSLEDCVRIAVEKSPDLAVAARRLDEAKAERRKTYAPFSPQGTFTAGQTQLGHDQLGVENKGNRWDSGSRSARVGATWNVFNGFRDWDRWRGAGYDEKASAENLAAARNQLVLETVRAYYGLLVAARSIEAQNENLKSKQEHYDLAKARFQAGVRSYSDVLNAQIQMKQGEIQLIDAQSRRSASLHALNILLDRPLSHPTQVVDLIHFNPVAEDLGGSIDIAFKRRPEILQAQAQVQSASAARSLAYHDFLPALSVGGLYDYAASGSPPASGALGQPLNPHWRVNLGLSFPFWDGGTRVQEIRRSRAAARASEENLRKVRRAVSKEVSQAYLSLERNQKVYKIADDQVRAAREDMKIISERYKNGGAAVLEVVDAQANLLQAQLDAIESLYDFHVAKHDLRRATGQEPPMPGAGGANEDQ